MYYPHELTIPQLVADVVQTLPKAAPIKTSKAPKKKPLTITGKATAPFVREDQVPASIRDYFATPPLETAVRSPIPASTGQRKVAIRGTAHILLPEKTDAIKVKPKVARKAKPPAIVVPPESAIKTANEQNLLFGTSSQLALEESPTFIRDMQQAVRESEVIDLPTSVPREDESQVSIQSTVSNLMNSRSITASRKLWSVSARDSTGSLLNVDVVDLANTPQPSRPLSMEGEEPRWKRLAEHPPEDRQATLDTGWKTVEDVTKAEEAAALGINPHPQPDDTSLPRSVAEASLRERPRSKSPVKKPGKGKGFQSSETESSLPEMPNYNGFADTDLRKELVALGFKPIKRRKEIIPLLQKCWESKNRVALQSLPPNVAIAPSSANVLPEKASESNSPAKQGGRPPKKPSAKSDPNGSEADVFASPRKARGRPKRNAATQVPSSKRQTQTSNEDIVDAGYTRPTSSPCRRVAAKPPVSPTLTTSLPVTAAADATEALFKTITKAITSYPPTHDAKNLTWYEKILLYDPIVLEDLADWLDKVGLSRVGYAGKVTPRMTKQWCESQSICCVWRENLRGGTRARY